MASIIERLRTLCLLLALCVPFDAAVAQASECRSVVVSADPEFPPFAWYDGKQLRGASVEIVTSILKQMQLPYEVRYVGPFVRLLQAARFGEVDIITELKDNPERRQFLDYAPTAMFRNPSSVFVRKGRAFHYESWEDLKGRRGGVTHGTRLGGGFDEFLASDLEIDKAPGIKENFRKLKADRIDYFVSPYYPAVSHLLAEKQEKDFIALQPNVAEAENFVGWSLRSPCLARLAEFDALLAKMQRTGEVQRHIDRGMRTWRAAPVMVR
ncbi:MAG: transporter substrate-binding domain-containing protein [Rhodocyclaceae bacterium]